MHMEENKEKEALLVTEKDVRRANIIGQTFAEKVEAAAPARIAASRDEKNAALRIRDLYRAILGVSARTEPFTVSPLAGRFGIPVMGFVYLVALAFYILGVLVPHPVAYMFLGLSVAVIIGDGAMFVVQVGLNRNTFNFLFPKKTSYNVLARIEARGNPEYTLVLGSRYDSDMDRSGFAVAFSDKTLPALLVGLIRFLVLSSAPALLACALAAICLHGRLNTAVRAFLFLFPVVFCGLAAAYLITYYSYKKRGTAVGSGTLRGAALAVAVADYLRLRPELVPQNCRIVVAAFGSGECGAKGSEQFVRQHLDDPDLLLNPSCIIFRTVSAKGNNVLQGEKRLRLDYDMKLSNTVFNAMKKEGLSPVFKKNVTMITDASPFAKRKIPAAAAEFRIGDKEITNAYDNAFRGAARAAVEAMEFMREERERRRGALPEEVSEL